jgi:integrase
LAQFSKALDRALTLPELHAFWRRLEATPESPARDALMSCMFLGGQRPTQVLRLTPKDVDISGATLTLLDPKGRNRHANPRRHVLPIHEDLLPVIRGRLAQTEGVESPLFSTNGRLRMRKETVALLVVEIEKAMKAAGELERGPFSMRDLRRTAETHMAALDRHDYMPEKRAALELWSRRFRNLPGKSLHVRGK